MHKYKLDISFFSQFSLLFAFAILLPHFSMAADSSSTLNAWSMTYEESLKRAQLLQLAQDPQWILLGHYKKNLWGRWRSDVTEPGFFVAKNGFHDPEGEMAALLQAFWMPPLTKNTDDHWRCRFPSRLKWLQDKLGLQGPPEDKDPILQACPMYQRYRRVVNAESVSFIFSSYYANSPGSAFGHTFFRINRKAQGEEKHSELLDHGIGYAAQVTVSNPVLYALFGLVGFFKGSFTNLPYYYKVREYNDYESRDLWSYDLDLTPAEVDLLVRHLWEIGNSYFDYYFFTQNCAYHMLTSLEAAAPRLHLTERVPRYYVIPSDAIKAVGAEPHLVKDVHYRPSLRGVFLYRFSKLNDEQKDLFLRYTKNLDPSLYSAQSEASQVSLLDATLDYIDMVYPENMVDPTSAGAKEKGRLLRKRAILNLTSPTLELPIPEKERPDLGHGSTRVALGFGSNETSHSTAYFEFRFALNDLLDEHSGYPQYSQLEFFHFRGEYDAQKKSTKLMDFDFFKVASYNPLSPFLKKPSWKIRIGAHQFTEGSCVSDCLAPGLQFGYGYAKVLDPGERILGYVFLDGQTYYNENFLGHSYKVAAGPTIGFVANFNDRVKIQVDETYFYQAVRDQPDGQQLTSELRYHFSKNLNLGLRYQKVVATEKTGVLGYYFF